MDPLQASPDPLLPAAGAPEPLGEPLFFGAILTPSGVSTPPSPLHPAERRSEADENHLIIEEMYQTEAGFTGLATIARLGPEF